MSRPTLTIIAGANGAGKSTLTAGSPGTFAAIPLLDPDAFANTLPSSGMGLSTIAAGKEVLRLTKEHVERRESFAVETTLSGKNYLQMMQHARGIDRGSCRCFSDQGRRCGQERVCYETRFTVLKARVTDEKADLSVLMPLGINGVEAAGGISSSQ